MNFCKDCKHYKALKAECFKYDLNTDLVTGEQAGMTVYYARRYLCKGDNFEPKPTLLNKFINLLRCE
jgi:hypothetical protein